MIVALLAISVVHGQECVGNQEIVRLREKILVVFDSDESKYQRVSGIKKKVESHYRCVDV